MKWNTAAAFWLMALAACGSALAILIHATRPAAPKQDTKNQLPHMAAEVYFTAANATVMTHVVVPVAVSSYQYMVSPDIAAARAAALTPASSGLTKPCPELLALLNTREAYNHSVRNWTELGSHISNLQSKRGHDLAMALDELRTAQESNRGVDIARLKAQTIVRAENKIADNLQWLLMSSRGVQYRHDELHAARLAVKRLPGGDSLLKYEAMVYGE